MGAHDLHKKRPLKEVAVDILKVGIPIAVSICLIVWLFNKVDIKTIRAVIRQGVDYRYIFIMMFLTGLSMVIRGVRWRLQLNAAGVGHTTRMQGCVAIFGAYALNLVFPFLGEAWRCVFISRRQHAKLSTVVGTDIGDRASDGIMIAMFIVATFFIAHPAIMRFLDHYSFGKALHTAAQDGGLWIGILIGVVVVGWLLHHFRNTSFVEGMFQSARRMWDGFAVLFHLKKTTLYVVLTVGIWACYFFQTYSCFYAFPFTRGLIEQTGTCCGLIPGLVVFVFGSCSIIVPSNGGLGPWNIAVMFALALYGISDADGAAYSIVCWSLQALTYAVLGIFSAIYIASTRRRLKPSGKG